MNYILKDNLNTLIVPADCRMGDIYVNSINNLDGSISIGDLEYLALINQDLSINSSPTFNLENSQSSITSVSNLEQMGSVGETIIANGNLQVLGTLTSVDSLDVKDPLISTGVGNLTNTVDLGMYSTYSLDGISSLYCGIARDHNLGEYVIFNSSTQPSSTLPPGYTLGNLTLQTLTGNITGDLTGNVLGNVVGNITGDLTGQVLTATQNSITSIPNCNTVGTLNSLTLAGDIDLNSNDISNGGTITSTNLVGNLTGSILTSDQSGITKVGTLLGLICSGQVEFNYNTASNNNLVVQNPPTASAIVIKAVNTGVNESAIIKLGSTSLGANGWNIGVSTAQNTVRDFYIKDVPSGLNRLICNQSGNFTLGDTDLATSNYKLYIDGNCYINGTLSGISTITATTIGGTLSTASQPNITTIAGITSIAGVAISSTQFGYLGALNQSLTTSSNVQFGNIQGTITTTSQTNITSIGTLTALTVNAQMLSQLDGIGDGSGGTIISRGFNSSVAYGGGISCSRARGTLASPSAVSTGDVLGGIWGKGYNTSATYLGNTGAIRIMANETFTSSTGNTYIDFATTPPSAVGRTIQMLLNGYGGLTIGSTTDQCANSYKLYSNGNSYFNGSLRATDGSSSAPSFTFINDTDCGLYRITTNTIALSTNTAVGLILNGSQNLTIGATDLASSTYKLYVDGNIYNAGVSNNIGQTKIQDGTNSNPAITFTSDTDTGIYRYGANALGISLGGTGYQLNSTTMGYVVGLYQSSAGFTTQNLTNLSSITGGNASIISISPAYQWNGSCQCTTSGIASTASFELKLPVAASGGQVNYSSGTISGYTNANYLVVGNITSSTQTYISISLVCNNIWASSSTIYLNFSIQYRNE